MTKEEFKNYIIRYVNTEKTIQELKNKYGVDLTNSKFSNFYNEYNYLLHKLLSSLFGETKAFLIEDYCFEQTDLSFSELCKLLNIE
ncbi:MAG TPA: hypothetical protein DDW20_00725 [Firmicutes bacterium]|nr:hypothetical protein [Bacillota bacterium]